MKVSLVDFNRSGVPLVELVTEPDFHSVESVVSFLKEIQLIVRYLGISSADMEKGSMRLEANVSLGEVGAIDKGELPNYKIELKNINSFKFVKNAITTEIERQTAVLVSGDRVVQETRGYNELTGETFSQRIKEEAKDYRYFPEPDIPPLRFSETQIAKLKSGLVELPQVKKARFMTDYQIPEVYAKILITNLDRANYFEEVCGLGKVIGLSPKLIADLIINKHLDKTYPEAPGLVKKIKELTKPDYANPIDVTRAVELVLDKEKKAVGDYKSGKSQVTGFLVGLVQKELKGCGNPKMVIDLLVKKLQT